MSNNNKDNKNKDEEKTFSVSVSDEVKMKEEHPGGGTGEIPSIIPIKKKCRFATENDIERILRDVDKMLLCIQNNDDLFHLNERGNVVSMAHNQICDEDPLRFFALFIKSKDNDKNSVPQIHTSIIVNPIIENLSGELIFTNEKCCSHPEKDKIMLQRYTQCNVSLQSLVPKQVTPLSGSEKSTNRYVLSLRHVISVYKENAVVFQHKISHLNGKSIYDKGYGVFDCIE